MSTRRVIKLVGFDANGTFFDDANPDGGVFYEALNAPFDRFGKPRLSIPELRERFTQPWTKIYRSAGITEAMASEADLYEIYNAAYQTQPPPNLAPGVLNAIARLCSNGIAVAIVSTQQNALTVPLLERHRVIWPEYLRSSDEPEGYPYLKAIIGGVHDKAEALRNLVAEMSFMSEEAVYIGDQDSDMIAARQAGCAAIAYLGGVHTAERLANAGAQYFLRDYEFLHSLTLFIEEHPDASYARGDDPGPFTDIIA